MNPLRLKESKKSVVQNNNTIKNRFSFDYLA